MTTAKWGSHGDRLRWATHQGILEFRENSSDPAPLTRCFHSRECQVSVASGFGCFRFRLRPVWRVKFVIAREVHVIKAL